jgi:S1-C subfamily serine protease
MKNTNGALVAGIEKGAPAEKGGLLPGDVITKFDGKVIESSSPIYRKQSAIQSLVKPLWLKSLEKEV